MLLIRARPCVHAFLAPCCPSLMSDILGAHEHTGSGVLFGDRSRPGILCRTCAARKVHAVDLVTGITRHPVDPGGTNIVFWLIVASFPVPPREGRRKPTRHALSEVRRRRSLDASSWFLIVVPLSLRSFPQLMLATGSADTTVRVWDVGEDLMPHADEWTRIKNRALYPASTEVDATGDDPKRTTGITDLENTVVGDEAEHDTIAGRGGKNSEGKPPEAGEYLAAAVPDPAASTEKVHTALHAMRPELLRQAGACAVWRTGRVTAVLDRAGCSGRRRFPPGAPDVTKRGQQQPMVEVR